MENQVETSDVLKLNKETSVVTYSLPGTLSQVASSFGVFFVAPCPCSVSSIAQVHTTAATIGTVTLLVERLQGTTAPGSGTPLMTSTFDLKATANTPQYAGVRGGQNLTPQTGLNIGDRLAMKVSGTLTTLQGVCVTLKIKY